MDMQIISKGGPGRVPAVGTGQSAYTGGGAGGLRSPGPQQGELPLEMRPKRATAQPLQASLQ